MLNRARRSTLPLLILSATLTGIVASPTYAVIPVVDAAALLRLLTQIHTMENQLLTARNQLTEAQSTLQSMTGRRGMENLLSNTARNYLPTDWTELAAALQHTGSAYGALEQQMQTLIRHNAVLSDAQLATLTPTQRELVTTDRQNAAALEGLTRAALASTSQRFSALQQLVQAIGGASDQKAILDLQARIGAETLMLQNDDSKLQALYRATDAEERARAQRVQESALADVGSLRTLPAMGL